MRSLIIFALVVLLLAGCADKHISEPTVVYKEKLVPVRCDAKLPVKPENDGTFETHRAKMIYLLECENLLKQCIGIKE
ncbi:hypothetical protein [Campylobacter majalis]|uniref:hypothetical protein n=1 Tax=Campylobacter majalis TaxID=2790656 RepID=UPI003D69C10E